MVQRVRVVVTLLLPCIVVACAGGPSERRPATPQTGPAPTHETASAVKVTILSTMLADQGVGEWGWCNNVCV